MPRRKKHPSEMTTDELARHLFHPEVLKAVKQELEKHDQPRSKRPPKKQST